MREILSGSYMGGGWGPWTWGGDTPPAAVDRPNQADSPPPPLSDKHLPG